MRRRHITVSAVLTVVALSLGPAATAVPGPDARPEPVVLVGEPDPDRDFGWEVAVDGDTAVTAATCDDDYERPDCLSMFVFVRSQQGWVTQAEIVPAPDPGYFSASLQGFVLLGGAGGTSIALSGDTLAFGVISVRGEYRSYSVRVYVRNGSTWTEQARLAADPFYYFGSTLSLDGDTLAIGATDARGPTQTFVYVRNGVTWSQQALLKCGRCDGYHNSALDGDTLLVGAQNQDSSRRENSGAVHVYTRSGTVWTHAAQITVPDDNVRQFGTSLALDGDTAAINSFGGGAGHFERAYVFVGAGASWEQQAVLEVEPDAINFGSSIDISGDTIAVGSMYTPVPGRGQGAAYLFAREDDSWVQRGRLTAPDYSGQFGENVAIDGSTLVAGTARPAHRLGGGQIRIFDAPLAAG